MTNNVISEIPMHLQETPQTEEVFYLSAEFWIAVTFMIVVIYLARPITKIIRDLIQKRINRIKQELNEAENIKLEAQKLYADTERSLLNVDKEIEDIITNKKYLIEEIKKRKLRDLDYNLQSKKADLDATVEHMSKQILKENSEIVCQKTINILCKVISAKLTKKDYSVLIDNSIESVKSIKIGD